MKRGAGALLRRVAFERLPQSTVGRSSLRLKKAASSGGIQHFGDRALCTGTEGVTEEDEAIAQLARRALEGYGYENRPEVREILMGTRITVAAGDPPVSAMAVALFNHADVLSRMSSKPEEVRELYSEAKQVNSTHLSEQLSRSHPNSPSFGPY